MLKEKITLRHCNLLFKKLWKVTTTFAKVEKNINFINQNTLIYDFKYKIFIVSVNGIQLIILKGFRYIKWVNLNKSRVEHFF
jgi:hypothetical protein